MRAGADETAEDQRAALSLPDLMLSKKEMLDVQYNLLKNLEVGVASARSRLAAANNPDDQAKLATLSVNDTLDEADQLLKESNEMTTKIQGRKVQDFPKDESALKKQSKLVKERIHMVKGCNAVIEKVKQDRHNEENRARSAVDYGLKRDLKKYSTQGVMRKIAMALTRIELRIDGKPADAAVEVLPVQAAADWDAQKVGLFKATDFEEGVFGLLKQFLPEAEAKAKTLVSKLGAKANLFGRPCVPGLVERVLVAETPRPHSTPWGSSDIKCVCVGVLAQCRPRSVSGADG